MKKFDYIRKTRPARAHWLVIYGMTRRDGAVPHAGWCSDKVADAAWVAYIAKNVGHRREFKNDL